MRRRAKEFRDEDGPLRLRRYDPSDWIDRECHPECAFWAAHEAWFEEHGFSVDTTNGPDVPWHPELI